MFSTIRVGQGRQAVPGPRVLTVGGSWLAKKKCLAPRDHGLRSQSVVAREVSLNLIRSVGGTLNFAFSFFFIFACRTFSLYHVHGLRNLTSVMATRPNHSRRAEDGSGIGR